MHAKFPSRPTVMLCRVVRSFIVVKGQKLYITPEIEDFLAFSANYSHSGAAVHQTNIKLLLWIADKWQCVETKLKQKGSSVCTFLFIFYYLFLFILLSFCYFLLNFFS